MSTKLTRELPVPTADVKRIIDCAWFELTASLGGCLTHELDEALRLEMNDERAHRNRGRGFATRDWRPAYRVSVEYAAKLFVLQWLYKAPRSVELDELNGLRAAVIKVWAIAARMRRITSRHDEVQPPTVWERFTQRVTESRYVYSKPLLRGGKIDQVPALQKNLLNVLLARCEYAALYQDSDGETLSLESPLFIGLDYSKDIADNG
jgi:hypothetical protein